jgi:hypothetical protein
MSDDNCLKNLFFGKLNLFQLKNIKNCAEQTFDSTMPYNRKQKKPTSFIDWTTHKELTHPINTLVCGGHLSASTAASKIFSHSKFGDVNYDNKEDCDWIIEAPPGNFFLINFFFVK